MRILIFGLVVILFIACSRKGADLPVANDSSGGLRVDVLGFASTSTTSNGIPTLWIDDGAAHTTFIPENHANINLYGVHDLQSVGGRNLVYFGTEIIEGVSRIVLFTYEGKKVLSTEVGLYLMPDRHESFHAHHRDAAGNLYIATTCQTSNYRRVGYVYKIGNLLEIEKIDMPIQPSFAVFPMATGIISLQATITSTILDLSIAHQQRGIEQIAINLAGYKTIQVNHAYKNFLGKILLLVSAVDRMTDRPVYFMFNIDVDKKAVLRHLLRLEDRFYQFGKGFMEGNILLVPGWERNTNRTFYLRIDTETDLAEIAAHRTDLEIDPKYPNAQALFMQKLDGGVFVGGTQFGNACYWKDGKLIMLKNEETILRSYPVEILTYRL